MEAMTVQKDELAKLIKEAVKGSMEIEFMKLRASLIPYISDEEQKDIENLYGRPSTEIAYSINLEI